jgi:two-component system chemotaxis response regulator CheY
MRALIVDDSRPVRRIEAGILRDLGFEHSEAGNGVEALAVLDALGGEQSPKVALVDWNMPEMDGLEFVKRVRKDKRFANMAIVMVTTEIEPEQMARALASGADEYLMKPFQREGLIEKLRLLGVVS